jgi:hypothetical protein
MHRWLLKGGRIKRMGWKTHLVQDRGATSFDLIARLPGSFVSISNCQYTDLLPPFIHHSAIRLQVSLLLICYSHIDTTTAWKQQQSRICCAGRKTVSSLNCPMCLYWGGYRIYHSEDPSPSLYLKRTCLLATG